MVNDTKLSSHESGRVLQRNSRWSEGGRIGGDGSTRDTRRRPAPNLAGMDRKGQIKRPFSGRGNSLLNLLNLLTKTLKYTPIKRQIWNLYKKLELLNSRQPRPVREAIYIYNFFQFIY